MERWELFWLIYRVNASFISNSSKTGSMLALKHIPYNRHNGQVLWLLGTTFTMRPTLKQINTHGPGRKCLLNPSGIKAGYLSSNPGVVQGSRGAYSKIIRWIQSPLRHHFQCQLQTCWQIWFHQLPPYFLASSSRACPQMNPHVQNKISFYADLYIWIHVSVGCKLVQVPPFHIVKAQL